MSDYEDYDSDASKTASDDDDIIIKPAIRGEKKTAIGLNASTGENKEDSENDDDTIKSESENDFNDDDDEFNDDDDDDDEIEIDEDGVIQEKKKKVGALSGSSNKKETSELDEYEDIGAELLDTFDDEDDDDESNEFYLQKFNSQIRQNALENFHPELHQHNMDEIEALCKVVRDEMGNIIDPLHRTLPFLTKYEKARILGERTVQINNGAKPLVEVKPDTIDGYLIALDELAQKKIPFIIKRPLPNGGCEYWKLKDLEIYM